MPESSIVELFDVKFNNATHSEALIALLDSAEQGKKVLVVTPNVDHLVKLRTRKDLLAYYAKAAYIFVDGMPIVWFSHLLPERYHLKERVTGSDLVLDLLNKSHQCGQSVGFIGGEPGSAAALLATLRERFPEADIRGVISPPFGFENDETLVRELIETVNQWDVDHLMVGLGFPKQEKFVLEHWDAMKFHTTMGVGAGIDMAAGYKKRAPQWVQKAGFEWFWRFLQEPRRLYKRYFITDMKFFRMAWEEYWKIKKGY